MKKLKLHQNFTNPADTAKSSDKNGNTSTMGEMLLPQYKKGLESGENPEFKLLS